MVDLAAPTSIAPRQSPVDHGAFALAHSFVGAIVGADFDRLQSLFAPDVRFRAIVPRGYRDASTAAAARTVVEDWFGGTDERELIGWTVDVVGDRLVLGYRLELMEDGERRVVEQHVAAIVDGAVLRDVSLICSGFRRLVTPSDRTVARRRVGARADTVERPTPVPSTFVPAAHLDATGLSCATLTPRISAAVRGLDIGAVLEVVTDDPEAEQDLRSWARLTGNAVVAAAAGPGAARTFSVRRMPPDAAPHA